MICPYCGADNSICWDSRQKGMARDRTYKCRSCEKKYYTKETLLTNAIVRVDDAREELENVLNAIRAAMRGANSAMMFLGKKEEPEK